MSTAYLQDPRVTCQLVHLLENQALAKALQWSTHTNGLAITAGQGNSAFKGQGLEFAEVRAYAQGDDVRHIDWRVSARKQRLHSKLYQEERQTQLWLATDYHPGLWFGSTTQFKSVLIQHLLSTMGWLGVFNDDGVGGLLVGPNQQGWDSHCVPPKPSTNGLLPFLYQLIRHQPNADSLNQSPISSSGLDVLLQQLIHQTKPGAMIVIASDFLQMTAQTAQNLATLASHRQMFVYMVADPLESTPPPLSADKGQGKRSSSSVRLGSASQWRTCHLTWETQRQQWRQAFQKRLLAVQQMCHDCQVKFQLVMTDDALKTVISQPFHSHL